MSSKTVTNLLLGACDQLYMQQPGDDTTVATIKAVKPSKVVLFFGPPIDINKDKDIPPIGYIKGIDLVTQGVLTIRKATEKLEKIKDATDLEFLYKEDGASKLARML